MNVVTRSGQSPRKRLLMKVIYPPLVEDAYRGLRAKGYNVTKEQTYKRLIETNMIQVNGEPTQAALDEGLVDSFIKKPNGDIEPENLSAFKTLYPCYAPYADRHFRHTAAGWTADAFVVRDLSNKVLNDPDSTDEARQAAYGFLDDISHWED